MICGRMGEEGPMSLFWKCSGVMPSIVSFWRIFDLIMYSMDGV